MRACWPAGRPPGCPSRPSPPPPSTSCAPATRPSWPSWKPLAIPGPGRTRAGRETTCPAATRIRAVTPARTACCDGPQPRRGDRGSRRPAGFCCRDRPAGPVPDRPGRGDRARRPRPAGSRPPPGPRGRAAAGRRPDRSAAGPGVAAAAPARCVRRGCPGDHRAGAAAGGPGRRGGAVGEPGRAAAPPVGPAVAWAAAYRVRVHLGGPGDDDRGVGPRDGAARHGRAGDRGRLARRPRRHHPRHPAPAPQVRW